MSDRLASLSAYLYEETRDPLYQEAAELSLDFIINFLWNGTLVLDTFILNTCRIDSTTALTYNQAWFIEGELLSALLPYDLSPRLSKQGHQYGRT